jgi:hypothetical protein
MVCHRIAIHEAIPEGRSLQRLYARHGGRGKFLGGEHFTIQASDVHRQFCCQREKWRLPALSRVPFQAEPAHPSLNAKDVINFAQQSVWLILSCPSELPPAAPPSADTPQWLRRCVHRVLGTDRSQLGLLLILLGALRVWLCHACLDTTRDPEPGRLEVAHTSRDGTGFPSA